MASSYKGLCLHDVVVPVKPIRTQLDEMGRFTFFKPNQRGVVKAINRWVSRRAGDGTHFLSVVFHDESGKEWRAGATAELLKKVP